MTSDPGVKAVREEAEEDADGLTRAERRDFREWNRIRRSKDPDFKKTEQLFDDQSDLRQIVDGKKASVWVWKQVGVMAKWTIGVVGAIVAIKTYFASGGVKP